MVIDILIILGPSSVQSNLFPLWSSMLQPKCWSSFPKGAKTEPIVLVQMHCTHSYMMQIPTALVSEPMRRKVRIMVITIEAGVLHVLPCGECIDTHCL